MSVSVASIMPIHCPQLPYLGIHRGALDQTLVTTEPPSRVMERVHQVLNDMGVLVQVESEFKYRCIHKQQKRPEIGQQSLSPQWRLAEDAVDEIRFSVELTRLDGLQDTFSLDVRRLKGNLRGYKLLYDALRQRAADLL